MTCIRLKPVALLLFFGILSAAAQKRNWIATGGDFTHVGYRADSFPSAKNVTVAWTFDTNSKQIESEGNAWVYNGAVYYINPVSRLFSLDAKTGALNYMLKLDPNDRYSFYQEYVIDDETGVMYASLGDIGKFLAIQLLDKQAKIMWSQNGSLEQITVGSKLNRVFAIDTITNNRQLVAYDRSTGARIAEFNADGSATGFGLGLTDDQRLIATLQSGVAEFDAGGDGRKIWQVNLPLVWYENIGTKQFIYGNMVVLNAGNVTVAIDLDKRGIVWKTNNTVEEHCQYIDSLASDGKLVFRPCLYTMYVYNMTNGAFVYSVPINPESGFDIYNGNIMVLENIAVSVIDGGLVGVEKTSGKIIFKYVDEDALFNYDWSYSNGMFFTTDQASNTVTAFRLI